MELAKVIEPFDGIYASHMRDEANFVVDAVKETIDVGRKAGVRVDISHHKMLGKPNWGKQKETLRLIHEANDEGVRVICDQYPYTRNMTTLNACMPPWHFSNGFASMTAKLADEDFRRQLRAEMEDPATAYDNYYLNAGGWEGVYVYSASKTPLAEGKSIADYARAIGEDPWKAFFDLCQINNCSTGGVYSSMCDEDVCEIFRDPYCIVGSDALTRAWNEKGHPRACATFPHAITYFVKEKNVMPLQQVIRGVILPVGKEEGAGAGTAHKARGVVQEHPNGDILIPLVGHGEVREVGGDRLVQLHPAILHQEHHGRSGVDLADGARPIEDIIGNQAVLRQGVDTSAAREDDLPIFPQGILYAGSAAVLHSGLRLYLRRLF